MTDAIHTFLLNYGSITVAAWLVSYLAVRLFVQHLDNDLKKMTEDSIAARHEREIAQWQRQQRYEDATQRCMDGFRNDDMMAQHLAINEKVKNDDESRHDRLATRETPFYVNLGTLEAARVKKAKS